MSIFFQYCGILEDLTELPKNNLTDIFFGMELTEEWKKVLIHATTPPWLPEATILHQRNTQVSSGGFSKST